MSSIVCGAINSFSANDMPAPPIKLEPNGIYIGLLRGVEERTDVAIAYIEHSAIEITLDVVRVLRPLIGSRVVIFGGSIAGRCSI